MNMSPAKLKSTILYFCENTDSRYLGKVKLMKLFYFLDFLHVKKYGFPVTGDRYFNLEHGPIPTTIKNLVDNVADDFDHALLSDTIEIQKPVNSYMQRIIPLRAFGERDKKLFSESEMEVLEEVANRFARTNTDTIEKISHEEAPWKNTKLLDEIPYTLAAEDKDSHLSREEIELYSKL